MIVLLDAGNSRFKWAECNNGELSSPFSCDYGSSYRAEAVMRALSPSAVPNRFLVSNVLGADFAHRLSSLSAKHGLPDPEFVVTQAVAHGVTIAYSEPAKLGVDRFLALIAAKRYFPGACVAVDCGSAVTIDALAADGKHLGGVILPGLRLMQESLISNTAAIKEVGLGALTYFGKDTQEAVMSGTVLGLVAAIDSIVSRMSECLQAPRHCIISGGDAQRLAPLLEGAYHEEPALVLKGLAIVAGDG